jgi:transcriptional regulator with XRE-family HTH domain
MTHIAQEQARELARKVQGIVDKYGSLHATEAATGLSKAFISRFLSGKILNPNQKTLEKIELAESVSTPLAKSSRTATFATRKSLVGQRFGMLVVQEFHDIKSEHSRWKCLCDCGNTCTPHGHSLKSGKAKSCGCQTVILATIQATKHGRSKSREYKAWVNMQQRCDNPKTNHYKDYGGRGIAYCDKWKTFEGFFEDMGKCPDGLTIERIDNNKGYSKDNCKWATYKEQAKNKRNTQKFDGITLTDWSEKTGIKYATLLFRVRKYGNPFPYGADK